MGQRSVDTYPHHASLLIAVRRPQERIALTHWDPLCAEDASASVGVLRAIQKLSGFRGCVPSFEYGTNTSADCDCVDAVIEKVHADACERGASLRRGTKRVRGTE
jgi:hypothetical protein